MLAVTILIAATNAGVLGVSRLTYSMGMYRQLPDTMRRLHTRYRTPYVGILVFSGVACLALLPGQADFLGKIYAFGAMLSFSMAHLSLICLRVSEPDARRPYRSPGRLRVRGYELPPLAIIGLTGTVLSFVVVSVLDLTVGAAGVTWMAVGMGGYLLYRRSQGLDFISTHQVAVPQPVSAERGRVRVRARGARRPPLLAVDDGHRDEAGRPQAPRDPRARAHHRAAGITAGRRRCPRRRSPRGRSSSRRGCRAGGA